MLQLNCDKKFTIILYCICNDMRQGIYIYSAQHDDMLIYIPYGIPYNIIAAN